MAVDPEARPAQPVDEVTAPEVEPKAATFDEQIDKFLNLVKIIKRNWVPLFAATAQAAAARRPLSRASRPCE